MLPYLLPLLPLVMGGRGKQNQKKFASMLVNVSVILGFSRYGETSRRQAKLFRNVSNIGFESIFVGSGRGGLLGTESRAQNTEYREKPMSQ